MVLEPGAEPFQGLDEVVLHGVFGEVEGPGDLFVAEALVAAHIKYFLFLRGEFLQGGLDKAAAFFQLELFVGGIAFVVELAPEVVAEVLVMGDLFQLIEGLVAGEGNEPAGGVLDICEAFPTLPYLEENFLGDLFGDGGGLGGAEDEAIDAGAVMVEKEAEGVGIAFRDLAENSFFVRVRYQGHVDGLTWRR